MKQTVKTASILLLTLAAVVIAVGLLRLIGAVMIHISETCNIPL